MCYGFVVISITKGIRMKVLSLFMMSVLLCGSVFAASIKSGESVIFQGDSITQNGWNRRAGYVKLCMAGFEANGIDVVVDRSAVSGRNSTSMRNALQREVIDKKPTYMTLSAGVNDIWQAKGVPLSVYKTNVVDIISRAQAAGIKVILFTITMIYEDAEGKYNVASIPYNEFLWEIAKEKGCVLVDLNAEMRKHVAAYRAKTGKTDNYLTSDGVHVNSRGDYMMARTILKEGFGFTHAELEKAEAAFKALGAMPPIGK